MNWRQRTEKPCFSGCKLDLILQDPFFLNLITKSPRLLKKGPSVMETFNETLKNFKQEKLYSQVWMLEKILADTYGKI